MADLASRNTKILYVCMCVSVCVFRRESGCEIERARKMANPLNKLDVLERESKCFASQLF